MNTGLKIKKIRMSKLMSLTKLSQKSGISRSFLSEIESGKKNISLATLEKIAKAFNMKPHQVLDDTICPFCGHRKETEYEVIDDENEPLE